MQWIYQRTDFSSNMFPEFNLCTYQTYVDFSDNNFSDQIPVNFGPQIRTLSLKGNKFPAQLPRIWLPCSLPSKTLIESLATISHLQVLNLRNDRLEASIPCALCKLSMHYILDLSGNYFARNIPVELGRLNGIIQTPASSHILSTC